MIKIKKYFFRVFVLLLRNPARLINHIKLYFAYLFCGFLKGRAPWPSFVNITINRRCNLRCKTCDMGQQQRNSSLFKSMADQDELGLEQWKIVIDKIAFFRPVIIVDTVEPLLHRDILGFIKFVKREKDLRCILTTNGFYLEKYADELASLGLERINVSIDGIPEIHDKIRGVEGSFTQAIAGIKRLKSNTVHPHLGIHYTISNYNYSCLKETIDYLSNIIEWNSFLFIHLSFVSPDMAAIHNKRFLNYQVSSMDFSGVNLKEIKTSELANQIQKVKKAYSGKNIDFHPDLIENQLYSYYKTNDFVSVNPRCKVPWRCTQILSNGDVIALNRCGKESFGNLLKINFSKIWNGQKYRDFRLLLKKERAFPICARCGGLEAL